MKNISRISKILGSWTSTTHLKADIGSYELMAYFVIHFMPDPMSAYACSIQSCHELENNICVLNSDDQDTNTTDRCESMDDSIVEWSDGKTLLKRSDYLLNIHIAKIKKQKQKQLLGLFCSLLLQSLHSCTLEVGLYILLCTDFSQHFMDID